jgi:hypothetical protein
MEEKAAEKKNKTTTRVAKLRRIKIMKARGY